MPWSAIFPKKGRLVDGSGRTLNQSSDLFLKLYHNLTSTSGIIEWIILLLYQKRKKRENMLDVFICRGVVNFVFFRRFDFVDKWETLVINKKNRNVIFSYSFRSRLMGFMTHNNYSVHPHQPHLISFRNYCIALIVATFFGRNNHSIVFSTRARH